ncbi:MAG: hypothetical protein WCQ60_03680 [bacterium]
MKRKHETFPRPHKGSIFWILQSIGLLLSGSNQNIPEIMKNTRRSATWSDRHPVVFWVVVIGAVLAGVVGLFYVDGNVLHNVPSYSWKSLKFWH